MHIQKVNKEEEELRDFFLGGSGGGLKILSLSKLDGAVDLFSGKIDIDEAAVNQHLRISDVVWILRVDERLIFSVRISPLKQS